MSKSSLSLDHHFWRLISTNILIVPLSLKTLTIYLKTLIVNDIGVTDHIRDCLVSEILFRNSQLNFFSTWEKLEIAVITKDGDLPPHFGERERESVCFTGSNKRPEGSSSK